MSRSSRPRTEFCPDSTADLFDSCCQAVSAPPLDVWGELIRRILLFDFMFTTNPTSRATWLIAGGRAYSTYRIRFVPLATARFSPKNIFSLGTRLARDSEIFQAGPFQRVAAVGQEQFYKQKWESIRTAQAAESKKFVGFFSVVVAPGSSPGCRLNRDNESQPNRAEYLTTK